jgi:hypothetical protein
LEENFDRFKFRNSQGEGNEFSQMCYCASCAGPLRGVGQRADT